MKILHSRILGSGPPLIILHGFLGMSDNWKSLGSQLANSGFQVHLVDQRNHGRSFWSEDFNYGLLVEDLLNYYRHHGIGKSSLIGHSMGGKTAMLFACHHPERIEKLIVADIGPKHYPPHHQMILESLNKLDLTRLKTRNEADEALSESIKDWGIRQFLLKNLFWVKPGILAFRMNLAVLKTSMEQIGTPLPGTCSFSGPSLFLRGSKSNYILDEDFMLIRKHFPEAEIQTIQNAGHWLHAEKPADFLNACFKFLNLT